MALHTELPIHKVAYDLAGLTVDLVKNMPREVKAVIGGELRDECLKLIVLIFRANVASDKRLAAQPADFGLPIGNLSSQFFANVYLDELDQFAKHRLRVRHYIRYVDDFVLLHESPQQLNAWRAEIEAFLPYALGLRLNPRKTILQPIERGIDFVGQVIKPWRTIVRRRTVAAAMARTAATDPQDLLATANSYFGLLRQATRSHKDRARLANYLRTRGRSVDRRLTKTYRP